MTEAGKGGGPAAGGGRADGGPAGGGPQTSAADGRPGAGRAGPLGDRREAGAHDAVRQARANFVGVHGRNAIVDGSQGDVHLGDHHHYHGTRESLPRLISGAVPRDELRRLRLVFEPPPGYLDLKTLLERQRLLALCGDPGTGRGYTTLSLLDEVTRGRVERIDASTELDRITASDLQEGHGYCIEITGDEPVPVERRVRGGRGDDEEWRRPAERPAEIHLDRLSRLLDGRDAYAVLVVGVGGFADELLRGRYGRLGRPASADGMLRRHLVALLGHSENDRLEQALALARRPDVVKAMGLDRLRPHEVRTLAGLLVAHLGGETPEDELLAELRLFSHQQAQAWFDTTGRAVPRHRDAPAPALRQAAFRTAVSVYNGSPYSVAAEAAEQLAWEFAQTTHPERVPGRALFNDHLLARLAAARAELFTGDVTFDERALAARKVRLQGRALSWAVLSHVWDEYHNARGPLCRWLRVQCDDDRPMVWIPAAITAGTLCTRDFSFVLEDVLHPMAFSDSVQQRMAAATALAHAAALDEGVRPVVRDLVRGWARIGGEAESVTAALVHGFGTVEPSVSDSLDALGRLAGREEREELDLLSGASFSVARLLAGAEPGTVLRRLGAWMGDRRQNRRNLALFTVDRMVWQRASHLWNLEDAPGLQRHGNWPLIAALLTVRPENTRMMADLVWCGLDTARWREELEISLSEWIRRAEAEPRLLDPICGFLPRLVTSVADAERLRNLVRRLERDPDESLTPATVRRLREAIPERPPAPAAGHPTVIRRP
ncbi:hypothetical protein JCM4814A_05190 [Streptomyces phaeofaciens JCM 4814]|uniref:Uncharacterized protein n=1 Tax=Streptomyces phaeofaciens TaxID=68254 RepID=A0A918HEF3_9ACTN|nr:hypothetical protein [Streptomyces phaeofaciens]GGT55218.1 hypothetical protein GCM10010226_35320 [Streptomyces phaeofaciens]